MNRTRRERLQEWFKRVKVVEKDWIFYSFAFIPFFIIGFAVWICLDEAIFALRYRVIIQWSLFPYFRIFADAWHYLGIALFIIGLILVGFTFVLHRGRSSEAQNKTMAQVEWYRIIRRIQHWLSESRLLVVIAALSIIFLCIGLLVMRFAFISQLTCSFGEPGIPCFASYFGVIIIETLFLHQLGDVCVAFGLVLIFIVIIRERFQD